MKVIIEGPDHKVNAAKKVLRSFGVTFSEVADNGSLLSEAKEFNELLLKENDELKAEIARLKAPAPTPKAKTSK